MATDATELPPFRFSLQAAQAGSRHEWVELVRRADDAGFDMLVTADHLELCLAPLVPLATAAEVSDRLRLGVMVLNNDFHHPALLARDVATLDLLSDGRVEVGLGAGHAEPEYRRAGLPFDGPGTRIDRLEEAVVVLRGLLAGEAVTFAGTHYRLTEARCQPLPVQSRVPVLLGGGRRVHRIAARHADAVGFAGLGRVRADGQTAEPSRFAPRRVDEDVAALAQAEAAAERTTPLERQVLVQTVVVTDDAAAVAARLAEQHAPWLTPEVVLATPYLMVGGVGALVDKLREHRARWGFTHYTVRAEALGQLEPVMATLLT